MLSMSWRMVRLLTDKYENDTLEDRKNDMAEVADLAETAPLIVCDSLVKIYKTKEVEVLDGDGLKYRGVLKSVEGNNFIVTVDEKVKVEGKKRPELQAVDHTFQMDKVKYTKYLINFK